MPIRIFSVQNKTNANEILLKYPFSHNFAFTSCFSCPQTEFHHVWIEFYDLNFKGKIFAPLKIQISISKKIEIKKKGLFFHVHTTCRQQFQSRCDGCYWQYQQQRQTLPNYCPTMFSTVIQLIVLLINKKKKYLQIGLCYISISNINVHRSGEFQLRHTFYKGTA